MFDKGGNLFKAAMRCVITICTMCRMLIALVIVGVFVMSMLMQVIWTVFLTVIMFVQWLMF